MPKTTQVTAYLDGEMCQQLRLLAKRNSVSLSEQIKLLIASEASRAEGRGTSPEDIFRGIQHIAIGVDVLLRYAPDAKAFEAAKEARAKKLGGPRNAD